MQHQGPDLSPRRSRRGSRIVAILLAGLTCTLGLGFTAPAAAQAYDPDEVRDLRVTRSAGDIALSFVDPVPAPDTHVVRRCTLAALRGGMFGAPYFGNCVATGVTGTTWSEPSPAGNVFYLVSGVTGGSEGSLGNSWNGRSLVPRPPTDCANPETPQPLTLIISLATPQLICGTQLTIYFPAEDLVFVSGGCSGLLSGFFGATNGMTPGVVEQVCGSVSGASGAGEIARFDFQRGDCPVLERGFRVTQCLVNVGDPDCGSSRNEGQICVVDVQ